MTHDFQEHELDLVRNLLDLAEGSNLREGLEDTPQRYLRAFEFLTSGYQTDIKQLLKTFADGAEKYDDLIFQGNIPVWSLCEHHLLPFFGVAHIGYIPDGRIVGLSKLARLTDAFARRLQVQERLTQQICDALLDTSDLKPKAVGVVLRCRHTCMESRGVQKMGTITYTSSIKGLFKEDLAARSEFLKFVEGADAKTTVI